MPTGLKPPTPTGLRLEGVPTSLGVERVPGPPNNNCDTRWICVTAPASNVTSAEKTPLLRFSNGMLSLKETVIAGAGAIVKMVPGKICPRFKSIALAKSCAGAPGVGNAAADAGRLIVLVDFNAGAATAAADAGRFIAVVLTTFDRKENGKTTLDLTTVYTCNYVR